MRFMEANITPLNQNWKDVTTQISYHEGGLRKTKKSFELEKYLPLYLISWIN